MKATRLSGFLGGCVLANLCLVATAAGWEIPLTVEEHQGVGGPRRVTCGVPLLVGQAKDVKDLRLLARDGSGTTTPVPAQFRDLARWWRQDDSIRWVLVDFATVLGAKETQGFVLTDAKSDAPAPKAALAVEQDANFITITAGAAKFTIDRKRFNFLDKAIVDVNGDGQLGANEDLLATTPDCGTVMEDTFGQKYFGSEGAASVEVLESGPMRVCVRARGKQVAREGKGYSPGMYGYDVLLNFYAGSTDVFADVIVTNNPSKSIGIPAFEDGSLILRLAGGTRGCQLLGQAAHDPTVTRPATRPVPAGPVERALAQGESICLYQDSNGADTWATCPGLGRMETNGWKRLAAQLTSFRGYQVFKRTTDAARTTTQPEGAGDVLATGDHARGTLCAWNDRGGVIAHLKNFWQQFPKAAEVGADGTVRLGLWPREWKYPHFLSDCSAKGYEIVLHFYGAKAATDEYVKDSSGRPAAEAVADCWDARVFARPSLAHMGATGALSDIGPYTPPTKGLSQQPGTGHVANGPRLLTDDRLYGNAYGWRIFGERWRSQGGHGSRGARQPIDEDNYLYLWYLTGSREWFAVGDARSRQFRDVRCYRIDDQDALGFKDWAAFRVANTSERREWTNRPQPDNDEIKKYREGLPDYGTAWEFPNPEHCVLDLLYDRYLIFGDVRSLENMRAATGHGAFFAIAHGPSIGRDTGWSWRTLERYWELTGDKRAEELLKQVIAKNAVLIGKAPLWHANDRKAHASDWFTQIWSRAVAATTLHTGDSKALDICNSLAEGKEKDAKTFSTLFATLYHLTGDEKYKAVVLGTGTAEGLLNVGGYFPASDHWLLNQPPKRGR